jgi:hypothetical protein
MRSCVVHTPIISSRSDESTTLFTETQRFSKWD